MKKFTPTKLNQRADAYGDNLRAYRVYMVNHEFGHALGNGHVAYPKMEVRLQSWFSRRGALRAAAPIRGRPPTEQLVVCRVIE